MATTCRPTYRLILADNTTFDFWGKGRAPGSASAIEMLDDGGLPPIEHRSQSVYGVPGDLILSLDVGPRVVTLTGSLYGDTRANLRRAKGALLSALRWDRGAKDTDPITLRATVGADSADSWDLGLNYSGLVTAQQGRHGTAEVVGVRLIAHDPLWRSTDTGEAVLDFSDDATMWYYAERVDGRWIHAMTQPAAVAAGPARVVAFAKDPVTGDLYLGGRFADWDNNALSDNIVRWVAATDTWENVGTDGAGGPAIAGAVTVHALTFGPGLSRTLYVAGTFTNAGGIGATGDWLAQVDVDTDVWSDVGGGHGAGVVVGVYALRFGFDGTLYVAGNFTDWRGDAAADRIVSWDGTAWANLGSLDGTINTIGIMPNGNVVAGGAAVTWGGVAANRIAEWDGAAWAPWGTGLDNVVQSVAVGPDGKVYVGGLFTTAGGTTARGIARWNGAAWSALGTGLNNDVYKVAVSDSGVVYAAGLFTVAGGLTLTDRVAKWNGFSWAHLDIDLAGAQAVQGLLTDGENLYVGTWDTGTAYFAGDNSVVNLGSAFSLPVITIENAGILESIRNETLNLDIPCDMLILDGETVTIDLSTGRKTVESNWRGNRLGDLLPNSDLGTFKLESSPRAQYGGVDGANLITVFITGAGVDTVATMRWTNRFWSLDEAILAAGP